MKAVSILYHDVIDNGSDDASGFPGPAAARYKLSYQDFEKHLEAISQVLHSTPATVFELEKNDSEPNFLLTFDDGGVSALRIGELLARRKWRAHFFVTTDYVGEPAFVTAQQIRELRQQGHVIGSHSCSHPRIMSACSEQQLLSEWRGSTEMLAEVLEELVTIASIPGGNYSLAVAKAAAQAGIKFLFTSEPVTQCYAVDGCWVLGRYGIVRGMPARAAADLATGRGLARSRQWAVWNLKKILKSAGGNYYHRLRDLFLGEKTGPANESIEPAKLVNSAEARK